MYSAVYYPHTLIEDPNLLKTSLLLWYHVTTITPTDDFVFDYKDGDLNDAWDVIGLPHIPTDAEKQSTHDIIADFLERPIPEEFLYSPTATTGDKLYEIYPEKFLNATFTLLRDKGLTDKPLPNADFPAAKLAGLHIMNILADTCAGETLARITDESSAYAALAGLLVEKKAPFNDTESETRDHVVSTTLDILDLRSIKIERLIEFRTREARESTGYTYRDLRHRYVDRVNAQVKKIRTATGDAACQVIREEFRESMQDDFKTLRGELTTVNVQALLTYAGIVSTVLVDAVAVFAHLAAGAAPLPNVMAPAAGVTTIAGLLTLGSKFSQKRSKTLREHPMSYLYNLR